MAVQTENISEEIVKNTIAKRLKNNLSEYKDRTSGDAPLVVTSFPEQRTCYPHVIVEEFDDSASPIDRRLNYHVHDFQVQVSVRARSSTEMFKLKDEIKSVILTNHLDIARNDGYFDLDLVSTGEKNWDDNVGTRDYSLVFGGSVFSV